MHAMNWKNQEWAGVFPATLCAFHQDESIDEGGLRNYFDELARVDGVKGLTCNGHTGEVMSLRAEERARVTKILASMKDFSHPGTTKKTPADLNRAIESTITVARNEWKYVAEMITDFDPTLPHVPCWLGEFNQVILNLVVNAAHAISDAVRNGKTGTGIITVRTRQDGTWAEIRVSDTGTGIPEEFRGRIFDPFFTTKEVGRGTGQGLMIAHTVIEKHEGTINFETEAGRGTTFIIRLPIQG